MKSSIKPVGGHRQQGGKRLRLFGSLVIIILTALNIIKSNVNIKQDGVFKDAYASSFGEPSQHALLDEPAAASLVRKHIVVAHCKEDVNWLDQLHTYDQSAFDPRCKIHIHIYSKCNVVVDLDRTVPNVAHCTTNHILKNIGTEEYAYFQYIQDMYDNLPSYVSFIQGGGITENPHIIYDLMGEELPGMTYKVLSRYVSVSWHMFGTKAGADEATKETEIFDLYFPLLRNHHVWLTGWRGMFTVSGSKIKQNPKTVYATLNFYLESKKCVSGNCNMETLFAPLFDCSPILGEKPNCTRGVYTNLSYPVIKEDYRKDGCNNCTDSPVRDTEWEICGRQISIFSENRLNGAMLCLELGSEDTSGTMMNFLGKSIEGDDYKSDFSNVSWGVLATWANKDKEK